MMSKEFIKRAVFYILILSVLPICSLRANSTADFESKSFPEKLDKAYRLALMGSFRSSFAFFEQMIASNPDAFIAYDLYAKALNHKALFFDERPDIVKTYRQAIAVYEKWLIRSRITGEAASERLAQAGIRESKKKIVFAKAIANIPPWQEAGAYGSAKFAIKSNLPRGYCLKVIRQIQRILDNERELLARIFGYEPEGEDALNVIIAGTWKDYREVLNETGASHQMTAFYQPSSQSIFLLYDGTLNTRTLAHELVHYLIRKYYIQNPSMIVDEGLAEYISYDLEKSQDPTLVMDNLEYINWTYDQGEGFWDKAVDFLLVWQAFLDYGRREPYLRMFYLRAWTFIYFFAESADGPFKDFLRKYLEYEKTNPINNYDTVLQYFQINLPEAQWPELDSQWRKFLLGLSYEKI